MGNKQLKDSGEGTVQAGGLHPGPALPNHGTTEPGPGAHPASVLIAHQLVCQH